MELTEADLLMESVAAIDFGWLVNPRLNPINIIKLAKESNPIPGISLIIDSFKIENLKI